MPHESRVQVRDPNAGPGVIRPAARPVDTFVQPNPRRPDPNTLLSGLADGLSRIQPGIQRFIANEQEDLTEEAIAEGQDLYRRNRVEFAEAVRRGLIPAGANPHLQRGYRVADLRNRAQQFSSQLTQRWAQSDARNSNDPEAFNEFVQEQTQEYLGSLGDAFTPSELAEGFDPEYRRAVATLNQQHTAYRVSANEAQAVNSTGQVLSGIIGNHAAQPVDYASIAGRRLATTTASALSQEARKLIGVGIPGRRVNRVLVDSIIANAESAGRPDLLSLADQVRTGSGVLSGIPEHQQRLVAARNRIEALQRSRVNHARSQRNRQQREANDRLLGRIMGNILESNGAPNADFQAQQNLIARSIAAGTADPEILTQINSFRRAVSADATRVNEDASDVAEYQEILANPATTDGFARIVRWASQGRISSGTVRSLGQFYNRQARNRTAFDSPVYKEALADMRRVITANAAFGTPNAQRSQILSSKARNLLSARVAAWAQQNPQLASDTAPGGALDQFVTEQAGEILNNPLFRVSLSARTAAQRVDVDQEVRGVLQEVAPSSPASQDAPAGAPQATPAARVPTPSVTPAPDTNQQGAAQPDADPVAAATTFAQLWQIGQEARASFDTVDEWLRSDIRLRLGRRWAALIAQGQNPGQGDR